MFGNDSSWPMPLIRMGFRKTRFKENLLWVKHAFRERERPTHMALYDLAQKKILREVDLEQHGMNVVFGMYPAAEAARGGNS